ncbi:MAG TPA: SDR family oxidoreductase [Candidatus Methanoperedens sp.]
MKKVLVTGCAGFIGSNIVERLIETEFDVLGIDDLSTGKKDNIKDIDFEFIQGSVNDKTLLMETLKNVDYILHQAAIPSVPRSIDDPIYSNIANIDGTLNLLVCAKDSGIKRVVYASSSSVYGNSEKLPKKENMKINPLSPYALTKYAGEAYCKLFNDIYGLETISLRYFNVFGKKQDPSSQYSAVIPKFIKLMLSGKSPVIFGDGLTSRDFSYIENNIEANILAMKAPKKACGKVYNIACGERTNLNELVEYINTILGTDIKPIYDKERPGDVRHSLADISLARKYLGYEPKVYFKEGLKKTLKWYKNE